MVRAGIPSLAGALALVPLAGDLATLTVSLGVVGIASGLLDVAMNEEAAAVEEAFGRRVMSSMHATWSISMLGGAAAASLGIAAELSIGTYIPSLAALVTAGTSPVLGWLPRRPVVRDDAGRRAAPSATPGSSFADVVLLCVVAAASFMTEGIAAEWSAVYLREAVGATAAVAGLGVVAFSGGMAVSRLAGDRLAARFAPGPVLRVGAVVGAAALAVSILAGEPAVTIGGLVVVGLELGPAVPLAFRAATRVRRSNGASALSIAVTAGYAGSIAGPLLVGATAELAGLRAAFAIPVVTCLTIASAASATDRAAGYSTVNPARIPSW